MAYQRQDQGAVGVKPEAANLRAISEAIDQHNRNCDFPAAEVRMNPFEVERLAWDSIRGLPIVADSGIATGRFRIVCARELDSAKAGAEEVAEPTKVGEMVEVGA
jgi:hypothetical protein